MIIKKILKISIIYTLIIIYSVEILLNIFLNTTYDLDDLKNQRIANAKKKNLFIDKRSKFEVYQDFKLDYSDLKSHFSYSPIYRFHKNFKKANLKNKLIPFRGPINSHSLYCSEDLTYKVIYNDKYGFNNSNEIYKKPIDILLLGDSFAEGRCVSRENDISGNLENKGLNVANFGVSGTSSLVSLGVLKEFGDLLKPKNIFYFYYEGNDLEGLEWEKKQKTLIRYLEKDFNNSYLQRYNEIEEYLEKSNSESYLLFQSLFDQQPISKKEKWNIFKNKKVDLLVDIIELKKIKNVLRKGYFKDKEKEYDIKLFVSVIKEMSLESQKLNSNFIFIYTPTAQRFFKFSKIRSYQKEIDQKQRIFNELDNMNIKYLDLTEFFEKQADFKKYYPLDFVGHFNALGYKEIANLLLKFSQ